MPWLLTEPAAAARHRRMRGTPGRCVALAGGVGREVSCTIYDARPEVCRDLEPGSEPCTEARALFGLPPLG